MKKQLDILAVLVVCVLVSARGFAQRGPGGGPEGASGPGGPGGAGALPNSPPAAPGGDARGGRGGRAGGGSGGGVTGLTSGLSAIADLQGELKSTNEEWLVVGPRLQKLIIARQAAEGTALLAGGTGGAGGGRGSGGGNDTFGGPSSVATGGRGGGGRGAAGARGAPAGAGGAGSGNGPGPNGASGLDAGGNAQAGQPGNLSPSPSPLAPAATDAKPAEGQTEVAAQMITLPQALADLQTALNEPSTSERQLKDLLTIVRAARAKAAAEAKAANDDLAQVLTADQIALLVSYGYLK